MLRDEPRTVIEIGPGRGALTRRLSGKVERLIVIELDPVLASVHRGDPNLEVVERDVLEVDLAQFGPATICGNLPYYITSPIIEHALKARKVMEKAIFLIQKEPAERIASASKSREYGYFSVLVQSQADPRYLFQVPPGAFNPAPKVMSAVIELKPRERVPDARLGSFLKFAAKCFALKRKTLRNNLLPFFDEAVLATLPEMPLRGEQLSVEELFALYLKLYPQQDLVG